MASSSQFARRAAEFKVPRFQKDSQEKRRADALAEQKRKRAERVQSSRNIDLFAGLSIGSPKADGASLPNDEDDEDDVVIPHLGLAQFVKMLPSASSSTLPTPSEPEIPPEHQLPTAFGSTSLAHARRKRKPKHNRSKKSKKPAKEEDNMAVETADADDGELEGNPLLANAIMYAELLEMNADLVEWNRTHLQQDDLTIPDGIPSDLETGWVALAPIPRGKRCMAISYQAVYDNRSEEPATRTLLHSRVKGKAFLTFPSPLPPNSILDCILDDNWHQNGVLHIVDILRWRGSDFVDCEAEFRFWWRDSKLSELPKFPLPNAPRSSSLQSPSESSTPPALFPYPFYFLGVPYYSPPLTLPSFLQTLIPAARSTRQLSIQVPIPKPPPPPKRPRAKAKGKAREQNANASMDVEARDGEPAEETMEMEASAGLQDEYGRDSPAVMAQYLQSKRVPTPPMPKTRADTTSFVSDGILLYVSQASYQPGETPLACWIPAEPLPVQEQAVEAVPAGPVPSPLDIFQNLIYRRCVKAKDALDGNGTSLSNAGVIPQR